MKISTRHLYGGTMILLILLALPLMSHAQEVAQVSEGFFSKIGSWVKGNLMEMAVGFVGGILAKGGWTLLLKKIAKKTAEVSVQLGEFFGDLGVFAEKVDSAIKDDGTVIPNSVLEAIEAGKHVIVEGKDVIISIKPKV